MFRDKITPIAAPPGSSMTDEPGRWPWERPPQIVDPNDAIDMITDKLSAPVVKNSLLKAMLAGITVEEIVNQIAFKGFMRGTYTPDVAELIKPAIGVFLYDQAVKSGFEPEVFREPIEEEEEFTDESFFRVLKERNPQLYSDMNEEINRQQRMRTEEEGIRVQAEVETIEEKTFKPENQQSFRNVEKT